MKKISQSGELEISRAQSRRYFLGVACATLIFAGYLVWWWQDDPVEAPPDLSRTGRVEISGHSAAGDNEGRAPISGNPLKASDPLTQAQKANVEKANVLLAALRDLTAEWKTEYDAVKPAGPALAQAKAYHSKQMDAVHALITPQWIEYCDKHSDELRELKKAQYETWFPLMVLEALRDSSVPSVIPDIVHAVSGTPDFRATLQTIVTATLGEEVSIPFDRGEEAALAELQKLEPALRERQSQMLEQRLPREFHQIVVAESKYYGVDRILNLYSRPWTARLRNLEQTIANNSNQVQILLQTLPSASDSRTRLATKLQHYLYPLPTQHPN